DTRREARDGTKNPAFDSRGCTGPRVCACRLLVALDLQGHARGRRCTALAPGRRPQAPTCGAPYARRPSLRELKTPKLSEASSPMPEPLQSRAPGLALRIACRLTTKFSDRARRFSTRARQR